MKCISCVSRVSIQSPNRIIIADTVHTTIIGKDNNNDKQYSTYTLWSMVGL